MLPVKFTGYNKTLVAPPDWDTATKGPCVDLYVNNDGVTSLSVWKLAWRERFKILFGAKMVLCVIAGDTQPPVMLSVQRVDESQDGD